MTAETMLHCMYKLNVNITAALFLFEGVSRTCQKEAIISSNTIQLDVSEIASKASNSEVCYDL